VRRRGLDVGEEVASGLPDEVLVDCAARTGARLIVVGSLGRRPLARWLLGSVAERTAQTSPVPVLVVRRSAAFRRWAQDGSPLRVVVGVDVPAAGDAVLGWVGELGRLGACDVVVVHARSPEAGTGWPGPEAAAEAVGERRPGTERAFLDDLAARLAPAGPASRVRLRLEAPAGGVADHLVRVATAEGADLVVVGTRQRTGLSRLWHGSVSNAVLHLAPANVLAVPTTARGGGPIPRWRRVLVPTDLSAPGDQAVPHAYAALAAGGTVHLMHVVEPPAEPPPPGGQAGRDRLVERLRALIPEGADERGIETCIELVESRNAAADSILDAAERLDVDLLCVASHGRSGLAATLAGSVARQVLRRTTRPLLLVRAPRQR
jgi:nucleotide-binding universal stress UspA family protein